MELMRIVRRIGMPAVLTVCGLVLGCSGASNDAFPQIASPPPFDYADGAELRSGMHQLAFELQQLDMVLGMGDEAGIETRDQIVSSLDDIERIGNDLQRDVIGSSHTFLQLDLQNFLNTVNQARMAAERTPPRYYMAGRVSGACVNCHQINR